MFSKSHTHHNDFNWGHQCSWILTPANSCNASPKYVYLKISPMTGYEPRTSGIGSDRSTN